MKAAFDRFMRIATFPEFCTEARHKMNGVIDSDSKANCKHKHADSLQRPAREKQISTYYRQWKDVWNQTDNAVAERAKFQRDNTKDDNCRQTQALGEIEIYLVKAARNNQGYAG
jgi:hypothetical protein